MKFTLVHTAFAEKIKEGVTKKIYIFADMSAKLGPPPRAEKNGIYVSEYYSYFHLKNTRILDAERKLTPPSFADMPAI